MSNRNPVAKAIAQNPGRYRQQVCRDRTKYSRKKMPKPLESD